MREIHHLADIQLHSEINRDRVFAFDQRVAQSNFRIAERIAVIVRRISVVAECENFFLVFDDRRGGINKRIGIVSRIDRRRINERFKDRTRLTLCARRAVKLIFEIIAPADHRDNLARFRTNGDQRGVQISLRLFRKIFV